MNRIKWLILGFCLAVGIPTAYGLFVGGQLKSALLENLTADSPTCTEGRVYYDTDDNQAKVCNGSTWEVFSPALADVTTTRGDLIRRGVSAVERFVAVTDNQVVAGDGTDVVSKQIDDPAFFTTGAAAGAAAIGIVTTAAQTFAGAKTFTGGIVGVTDASDATAGNIGEYIADIASVSAPVSHVNSAQYEEVASITLTAGDWDVSAQLTLIRGSASLTAGNPVAISIGTEPDLTTGSVLHHTRAFQDVDTLTGQDYIHLVLPTVRISISASDIYYLNGYAVYTSTAPTWAGTLTARRVR